MERLKSIFLQNNDLEQSMLKNIFWLSISNVSRLFRIIILLYAARVLGTTEYGTFAYILGIIGLFSVFIDLGINPLITRDAIKNTEAQRDYFATSFWMKIFLVAITSLGFFILSPFVIKDATAIYLVPFAVILIIFDNIRDFITAYLRGLGRMEKETIIVLILNLTLAIFGLVALITLPTAKSFFVAYMISSVLATIVALLVVKDVFLHALGNFHKEMAREIMRDGWPIAISGIFGVLMLNIDIFMLGFFRTTAEIGLYAAGQKIIQILYIIPILLASGTFPALTAIVRSGDKEREKIFNEKSVGAALLFAIPLMIGGIILAEPLFKLLFGHEYVPGVPAFNLLLLNMLVMFPGMLVANLVLAHNKQRKVFKFIVIASLGNILLNLLLIPKIGIIGAALATLCAQIINYGFTWREMKKVSDFTVFPKMKKVVMSVALMGVLTYSLEKIGAYVLLNVLISAFAYFALLLALKEGILLELRTFLKNLLSRPI